MCKIKRPIGHWLQSVVCSIDAAAEPFGNNQQIQLYILGRTQLQKLLCNYPILHRTLTAQLNMYRFDIIVNVFFFFYIQILVIELNISIFF